MQLEAKDAPQQHIEIEDKPKGQLVFLTLRCIEPVCRVLQARGGQTRLFRC